MDEKTRRIKEQTVRGLEPEIQRLLARHNAELAEVEAERERRLVAQERELHQRHLQHVRELRAQWEEDNAEGWTQERHLLAQRYIFLVKKEMQCTVGNTGIFVKFGAFFGDFSGAKIFADF